MFIEKKVQHLPLLRLSRKLYVRLAAALSGLLSLSRMADAAGPPFAPRVPAATKEVIACDDAFSGTQNARKNAQMLRARELATLCVQSCPVFARADCVRWLHEIDEATPTILFHVEGADDAAIYIDSKRVADHLDGRAIEVDPGRHRFYATVNGVETPEVDSVISEGEKRKEIVLVLRKTSAKSPPLQRNDIDALSKATPEEPGSSVSALVWVGGAITVVGTVVGTIAGVSALSKSSEAEKNCPSKVCPPLYHGTLDSLATWSTASTVSFVVAGAGLVAMVIGIALPAKVTKVGFLRLQGSF